MKTKSILTEAIFLLFMKDMIQVIKNLLHIMSKMQIKCGRPYCLCTVDNFITSRFLEILYQFCVSFVVC